jgi:hypothetical protein
MEEIDQGPGQLPRLVKDESHRMILELKDAIAEYKGTPNAG